MCQFAASTSLLLTEEVLDNDAIEFQQDDLGPLRVVSPEHLEEQEEQGIALNSTATDFITIHYHPRTRLPVKTFDPSKDTPLSLPMLPNVPAFAPFPSEADFRIAERMINTSASVDDINFMLNSHHDPCFKTAEQLYKCVDGYASIHEGVSASQFT